MPATFNIRLNPTYKGENGWVDALKASALEIEQLNSSLVSGGLVPIKVNPNSDTIEGFLGEVNTPPTVSDSPSYDGLVTVRIKEYDFIDLSLLPAQPTTFYFIAGTPPQSGTIA